MTQARSLLHGLAGLSVTGADQVEAAYDPSGQTSALAGATLACDLLYLLASWAWCDTLLGPGGTPN